MSVQIHAGDFVKWLKNAASKLRKGNQAALKRTATAAATYAKLTTLFKHRSYTLRKSIQPHVENGRATVTASAPHAYWLENGTPPHWIEPRDRGNSPRQRKWLRFEQNGAIRFAKRVWHPGIKTPRPFMKEARDKAEPLFDRLVREAATNAFR